MIILSAPYPKNTVSIKLPNPRLGDGEGLPYVVTPKRSMNGTLYTYVKTLVGHRVLEFDFVMTRSKGEEFKRFLLLYISDQIKIEDHLSRTWVGYITTNPIEFTTSQRGTPGGGLEMMEVSIEFEGEEI